MEAVSIDILAIAAPPHRVPPTGSVVIQYFWEAGRQRPPRPLRSVLLDARDQVASVFDDPDISGRFHHFEHSRLLPNQRNRDCVNARIQHADSEHRKCSDGQNRLEIAKTQPLRPLMHRGAFWSPPAGRSRDGTKSTIYEQIL